MPLLLSGTPDADHAARRDRWTTLLARQEFDPQTQMISASEVAAAPIAAAQLRAAVLRSVHSDEYPAGAPSLDPITRRLENGSERIIFWGEAEVISLARAILANGDPASRSGPLPLGTATVIDAADELGSGYGEMCRTGSLATAVGAMAPIVIDVLASLGEGRWHTLASVPRNRRSTAGVRGGTAIHRLHVRHLASAFWGLAPWYVLQDGVLEVLDYRELYAGPRPAASSAVLADPDDALYVKSLLQLNGVAAEVTVGDAPARHARWLHHTLAEGAREAQHPRVVRQDPDGKHGDFHSALAEAESEPHACVVVHLPLDEGVERQRELAARGYILGSVTPATGRLVGFWNRPGRGLPLALPYYLDLGAGTPEEEAVLTALRARCAAWERT